MSHQLEHATITDSDGIHEPKGAGQLTAGASDSGKVYVSDGAGSGAWALPEGTDVAATGEAQWTVLTANGSGGADWQAVDTDVIDSTGAADKTYLVADGAGGVAWQEMPYGGVTYENRATPVTITGSGGTSDVRVNTIFTTQCSETNSSSEFTIGTNGELQYTGTLTKHMHIALSLSADLATAATNNVAASIYWFDDSAGTWSRVTGSDVIFTANNTTIDSTAIHADIMLDQNDKLTLALQNIGGTADVRVYSYYLFAMGMPGT